METIIAAVTSAILSLLPHWQSDKDKARASEYAEIIVEECNALDPPVDPFLVVAIIFKESSFRAKVRGPHGEVGLMQIMPRGALTRALSKDSAQDVRANIRLGLGHLHYWQQQCGVENQDLWISAYNLGRCKSTRYAKRVKYLYCQIRPGGCGGIS